MIEMTDTLELSRIKKRTEWIEMTTTPDIPEKSRIEENTGDMITRNITTAKTITVEIGLKEDMVLIKEGMKTNIKTKDSTARTVSRSKKKSRISTQAISPSNLK